MRAAAGAAGARADVERAAGRLSVAQRVGPADLNLTTARFGRAAVSRDGWVVYAVVIADGALALQSFARGASGLLAPLQRLSLSLSGTSLDAFGSASGPPRR